MREKSSNGHSIDALRTSSAAKVNSSPSARVRTRLPAAARWPLTDTPPSITNAKALSPAESRWAQLP